MKGKLQWKFSGPLSLRNSWAAEHRPGYPPRPRLEMIFAYFAPPAALLRDSGASDDGAERESSPLRSRTITRRLRPRAIATAAFCADASKCSNISRRNCIPSSRSSMTHVHIGSSNFDFRSLYINMEIMLRIEDERFASAMRRYFDHEVEDCRQITPKFHRQRANLWRRVKWGLSHFLVIVTDYTVTRRLNFRSEL